MLLHIDSMVLETTSPESHLSGNGCSTVMCNRDEVIITHRYFKPQELTFTFLRWFWDILKMLFLLLTNIFTLSMLTLPRIVANKNDFLPCVTQGTCQASVWMSINMDWFIPSILLNRVVFALIKHVHIIIVSLKCHLNLHFVCLARHFLTRALLSARNLVEAQAILRDAGTGSAHGFCVNMTFTKQVSILIWYLKYVLKSFYNLCLVRKDQFFFTVLKSALQWITNHSFPF